MKFHHFASASELAASLATLWSGPRQDPFAFDLAVVPSAGFQRWLSQQLSLSLPEGICAGVEFVSQTKLSTMLAGSDDPWRPERLAWTIQRVVMEADCPPQLAVLQRHLEASREAYSATRRIATHFASYAEHSPGMLLSWAEGSDVGPDQRPLTDNAWQATLWRLLVAEIGEDPTTRRTSLLAELASGKETGLAQQIAVIAPTQLSPSAVELYRALAKHHRLDVLLLDHAPRRSLSAVAGASRSQLVRPPGHRLNLSLGAVFDETLLLTGPAPDPAIAERVTVPSTALGWLQEDLIADLEPQQRTLAPADRSVQVHLSHGPSRQVEVLREVLAALFANDPSLEPRHVVVITPAIQTFGPLLDAAFVPQPGNSAHPAQQFRLRIADRTIAQANPLVTLLLTLLRLPDSRIEASTLLEFCANEPISNRFGFTAESRERLAELVEAAGIRWGLNAAQRADYGLGNLAHNTWMAGLQRMLLGVAMSEQGLVTAGTVLPLDDIDSADIELIGGITELIGRLSRWIAQIAEPATINDWVERCRVGLESLITLPSSAEWQLADLLSGLSRLAEAGQASSAALIGRHAAWAAIEDEFSTSLARGAFGNGSMVVAGLSSLRNVPHRVVVLLGWDAEHYPRTGRRHGDDLLGIDPPIGTPSAALNDRQALLDAIHAATDQLVVICRGRSEATNAEVTPAAPISELLEALDATVVAADGQPARSALVVQHPLQPFATSYFTPNSGLTSVDTLAYRAAVASLQDPQPPRNRFAVGQLPPLSFDQGASLDDLTDYFRHPARAFLKVRAGIRLGEDDPGADEIPVEPNGLDRWQIGNRVLRGLRDGAEPQLVERAEWLRGQVPPFELGRQVMLGVIADARRTLAGVPPLTEVTHHDLSIQVPVPGIGEVNLVGRVATREQTLWQIEFSSLQPRQKFTSWIRLLALAAAKPGTWDAQVIGKGYRVRYAAPPQSVALELLGRYLAIEAIGLTRPLPALPRLSAEWANFRATGRDPDDPYLTKTLRRCWDWESDAAWSKFFDYPQVLRIPLGDQRIPGADTKEDTLLGALATSLWTPLLAAEVAS